MGNTLENNKTHVAIATEIKIMDLLDLQRRRNV
jgi:hypothetical protein